MWVLRLTAATAAPERKVPPPDAAEDLSAPAGSLKAVETTSYLEVAGLGT